ncbi:MarR family winged helix-turn-helix transcriptional regulator [Staphylococcus kloosii]|jgi:DNA-binding MarR family transcriptional regulator|uniref:MarR family transcriptional regulator n=1 Tax=Staphylococcus kloosii TaxID=29384 RepID=A0A921KVV5_9STAP|nr:MarR family transcriptional regulator [Staphylococcus kloosii]AVQ35495.1 MarR family transcriptional regulator [Staphylococcus kloosii]MBF7021434.1 MarR family transcriptional regulator [Staphylococcus kloosii]PNZ05629.1 MarR family transcriptional regulator [Staphylococcus kloosii]PTJ80384.1 MarR family transcriptional regulator [Staphylococcus kloosii]SUM48547.1 transcriptional regulator [Staphylococcus kloosii]
MNTKKLFDSLTGIYRPYVKLFQPIFEEYDLFSAQWLVLKDIALNEPTTLVQISKRRAIEKPTTRKILKVLSDKSLLTIRQGNDKRERILTLSKAGAELFEDMSKQFDRIQGNIVERSGITAEEADITIKTVLALHEQLAKLEEE